MQNGIEKSLLGSDPVSLSVQPPAFASDPLVAISSSSVVKDEITAAEAYSTSTLPSKVSVSDIVEIESPSSAGNHMKNSSPAGVRYLLFYFYGAINFSQYLVWNTCM